MYKVHRYDISVPTLLLYGRDELASVTVRSIIFMAQKITNATTLFLACVIFYYPVLSVIELISRLLPGHLVPLTDYFYS